RADLVLYDYLVNPRTLAHAPTTAELVCLGRHGHGRIMTQAEVNERTIAAAQAGKIVVRLKGGDPMIFAHAAEECQALAAAKIPFEIVPGITVALAAGAYAGAPLTHRGLASAVALITGRESADKIEVDLDYAALVTFPGTLVFYMGVTTAPEWSDALLRGGMPAETPVVMVRRCSWPDQQTIHSTLGDLTSVLTERKLRPPVITIVGRVASLEPVAEWFATRPLFGQRIIVTRPADLAESFHAKLEELGAEILSQPAIEIGPPTDWAPVDAALARLDEFDWLVFSSVHGVRFLLDRLLSRGGDMRQLGPVRVAAIGPSTAAELARYSLKADLTPAEYRAEGLAAALAGAAKGKRFLLARASRGRELLADELRAAGAAVEQVVTYESRDVTVANAEVAAALVGGHVDWITVSSSAIARSLAGMFGADLRRARLASISPITCQTLRELGYEPAVEATTYTMDGIIEAILSA
ncbi:MAG TPA: uroporphyrinogen-III C-methyltransferase, partial [Pirellulales bacterium]